MVKDKTHPFSFRVPRNLREAMEHDARVKGQTMTMWLTRAIASALPDDTPDTVGQRSAGE